MMRQSRHLLCAALVLVLLMSLAPMTALAASEEIPTLSAPIAEGTADASHVEAVIDDAAVSFDAAAENEQIAADLGPGDLIEGDLYDTDFQGRDGTVLELRDAMIARKNEIYLYWRSDVALTEADVEQLMVDALLLEDNPLGGDYLAMHVLDYYAEWAVVAEQPGSHYNMIGFAVVYSTTAEQEQELTSKVESLYNTIVENNNNHYLRVKNIYDWMIANVAYDFDNILDLDYFPQHTAYAAMVDGKASAIGISLLFHRIASCFDVETGLVLGTIDGNEYVWNAVNIYDTWYQVNVSYDILTEKSECFLRGYEDLPAGHKLYDQFLTPEFLAEYNFAKTCFIPESSISGDLGGGFNWAYNLATDTFHVKGEGRMPDGIAMGGVVPFSKELPLVIEEGVTYIGAGTFRQSAFYEVTLPDSLTEIGGSAFAESNVRTVIGGKNVKHIGDQAFYRCQYLRDYQLPEALETIGEKAFYYVPFVKAELPSRVQSVGAQAFYHDDFEGYVVDEQNSYLSAELGVLYNKDKTLLIATPNVMTEAFVLPKTVTKIGDSAFENCKWIGSLNLHEGFTEIGKNAFHSSTLSAVVLPSTLTGIPDGAFYTDSLKTIYIPTSVSYIGVGAFRGYNLDAHYGGTDEQWAQVAVYGDNNALNGIEKNSHKLSYRSSWTLDLDKMELVTNESSMNYPLYAFKDDIRSVIINAEYGPISAGIYTDWTGLQTVTINSAYIGISENAFAGCTGLTDVYYKNSEEAWVEHGFDKAFPDSPNLTVHYNSYPMSGQLGDNLQWNFDRTTNTLTISGQGPMRDFVRDEARPWDECLRSGNTYNVVIAEGVTSIGAFAFRPTASYGYTLNVAFPSTVEIIGLEAFASSSLGRLQFKDGLKTIGRYAFSGAEFKSWYNSETNEYVQTLILPGTVERIEECALDSSGLDVVYLPLSLKYIEGAGLGAYGVEVHYAGSVAQWSRVKNEGYYFSDGYKKMKPTYYDAGCPHIIATEEGKAATCYESGLTGKEYCTHCGFVRKEPQVIEQLSHYFDGDTCTNCGMVIDPSKPLDGNAGSLYWRFDINEATLSITGNGAIPDYAKAEDVPWSHWSGEVRVLFLDTNITGIGDNAFAGFDKLWQVRYITAYYKWLQLDIGTGNEALEKAEFYTSEYFTDVLTADWFYNPVNWAVDANVTGGIGNGQFGPNNFCTRAQVVTFLYAAAGKPEVTTTDNPFEDVADDAWYAKPVLWAVENGITSGIDATHFGPDVTCTRAQVVTFLYAAAGKPEITASSTFTDVADTDWYAKPVIWAKENDVTGGISATEFGPNQTCTRAQVVTFLYKVYG